jgi:hypothetical protein
MEKTIIPNPSNQDIVRQLFKNLASLVNFTVQRENLVNYQDKLLTEDSNIWITETICSEMQKNSQNI